MAENSDFTLKVTALIILNYNNYKDTLNCIRSVEHYNTAPVKLVVVDNGSTHRDEVMNLKQYVERRYAGRNLRLNDEELSVKVSSSSVTLPYITFIESSSNDGYARGNNKALHLLEKDADVQYVMILNNDVLFIQDIIPALVAFVENHEDAALVSPLLYKKDMEEIDVNCARLDTSYTAELVENFFHYCYQAIGTDNPFVEKRYIIKKGTLLTKVIPIELPSGSCMFIRKQLFADLRFFDPYTFLYFEENILWQKVKSIGKRNYLLTGLKCIHLGASTTSFSPSLFILDHNYRSARYYMKNYMGVSKPAYWLYCFSVVVSKFLLRLQKAIMHKK